MSAVPGPAAALQPRRREPGRATLPPESAWAGMQARRCGKARGHVPGHDHPRHPRPHALPGGLPGGGRRTSSSPPRPARNSSRTCSRSAATTRRASRLRQLPYDVGGAADLRRPRRRTGNDAVRDDVVREPLRVAAATAGRGLVTGLVPEGGLAASSRRSSASISANTSMGAGALARNTQVSQTARRKGGIFSVIRTQPSCAVLAHQ